MSRIWLLVACAALGACSKSSNQKPMFDVAQETAEPAAPAPQSTAADQSPALKVSVPQIAYVYDLSFVLPEATIGRVQAAHVALCDRLGAARCQVLGLERHGGDAGTSMATLKLRVATADARRFEADADHAVGAAGGRAATTSIQAEDVSKDISDTQARLAQRELLVQRLTEILRTRDGKVADLVEAERSVAAAQEEVDQARSWLAELQQRVAMSTFNLTYNATAPSTHAVPARLSDSVSASASTFVSGLSALLTVAIYLLPWAVLAGLVFAAWKWLQRRRPNDPDDPA